MKRLIFALALCLAPLPGIAASLVMVRQDGCIWCARWEADIAAIYPRTDEGRRAPLRRVDLDALPGDIAFKAPPIYTPTFVLIEDGRELGRIEGYPGPAFFWALLDRLLDDNAVAPLLRTGHGVRQPAGRG